MDCEVVILDNTLWYSYMFGYLFSIGGNLLLVRWVIESLWKPLGKFRKKEPLIWHRSVIGCIDSFIYTSSWIVGKLNFIAIWLAFKIAGRWNVMFDSRNIENDQWWYKGKVYNIFHIGNGLTVIYGFIGGMYIQWIQFKSICKASIVPFFIIVLTLILCCVIKRIQQSENI